MCWINPPSERLNDGEYYIDDSHEVVYGEIPLVHTSSIGNSYTPETE